MDDAFSESVLVRLGWSVIAVVGLLLFVYLFELFRAILEMTMDELNNKEQQRPEEETLEENRLKMEIASLRVRVDHLNKTFEEQQTDQHQLLEASTTTAVKDEAKLRTCHKMKIAALRVRVDQLSQMFEEHKTEQHELPEAKSAILNKDQAKLRTRLKTKISALRIRVDQLSKTLEEHKTGQHKPLEADTATVDKDQAEPRTRLNTLEDERVTMQLEMTRLREQSKEQTTGQHKLLEADTATVDKDQAEPRTRLNTLEDERVTMQLETTRLREQSKEQTTGQHKLLEADTATVDKDQAEPRTRLNTLEDERVTMQLEMTRLREQSKEQTTGQHKLLEADTATVDKDQAELRARLNMLENKRDVMQLDIMKMRNQMSELNEEHIKLKELLEEQNKKQSFHDTLIDILNNLDAKNIESCLKMLEEKSSRQPAMLQEMTRLRERSEEHTRVHLTLQVENNRRLELLETKTAKAALEHDNCVTLLNKLDGKNIEPPLTMLEEKLAAMKLETDEPKKCQDQLKTGSAIASKGEDKMSTGWYNPDDVSIDSCMKMPKDKKVELEIEKLKKQMRELLNVNKVQLELLRDINVKATEMCTQQKSKWEEKESAMQLEMKEMRLQMGELKLKVSQGEHKLGLHDNSILKKYKKQAQKLLLTHLNTLKEETISIQHGINELKDQMSKLDDKKNGTLQLLEATIDQAADERAQLTACMNTVTYDNLVRLHGGIGELKKQADELRGELARQNDMLEDQKMELDEATISMHMEIKELNDKIREREMDRVNTTYLSDAYLDDDFPHLLGEIEEQATKHHQRDLGGVKGILWTDGPNTEHRAPVQDADLEPESADEYRSIDGEPDVQGSLPQEFLVRDLGSYEESSSDSESESGADSFTFVFNISSESVSVFDVPDNSPSSGQRRDAQRLAQLDASSDDDASPQVNNASSSTSVEPAVGPIPTGYSVPISPDVPLPASSALNDVANGYDVSKWPTTLETLPEDPTKLRAQRFGSLNRWLFPEEMSIQLSGPPPMFQFGDFGPFGFTHPSCKIDQKTNPASSMLNATGAAVAGSSKMMTTRPTSLETIPEDPTKCPAQKIALRNDRLLPEHLQSVLNSSMFQFGDFGTPMSPNCKTDFTTVTGCQMVGGEPKKHGATNAPGLNVEEIHTSPDVSASKIHNHTASSIATRSAIDDDAIDPLDEMRGFLYRTRGPLAHHLRPDVAARSHIRFGGQVPGPDGQPSAGATSSPGVFTYGQTVIPRPPARKYQCVPLTIPFPTDSSPTVSTYHQTVPPQSQSEPNHNGSNAGGQAQDGGLGWTSDGSGPTSDGCQVGPGSPAIIDPTTTSQATMGETSVSGQPNCNGARMGSANKDWTEYGSSKLWYFDL